MFLNLGTQHLDGLLRSFEGHMGQYVQQTFVGELLLLAILSLVESVGLDEQRAVRDILNLFALELEARPESDGAVGNHFNEVGTALA